MPNRKRDIRLRFWVTQGEREQIEKKMEQFGTSNMAAYLRKIAIDGYVVHLELPELREMVSLLRRSSNSLNQIAKRMNETGAFTTPTWTMCSKIRSGYGRRQTTF